MFHKEYKNQWVETDIDGRHFKFRSKGEYKLALYLQTLKQGGLIKEWYHEQHKFMFPDSSWLVDFTVVKNESKFIEIEHYEYKGFVERDTKKKLQLVNKYYPDAQIIMVMADNRGVKKLGSRATSYCKRVTTMRDLTRGII